MMPNDVASGSATFIKHLFWPASYSQFGLRRFAMVFGRLLSFGVTHAASLRCGGIYAGDSRAGMW
jgi:hypothetical protein